jgi:hypothetical protein
MILLKMMMMAIIIIITPGRLILSENPSVVQLLKNFPVLYVTRILITVFKKALH